MSRLAEAFTLQAAACTALGSPFTARLCTLCAENLVPGGQIANRLINWPGDVTYAAASLPLRLAGALHALALSGDGDLAAVYPPHHVTDAALWCAVSGALTRRAPDIDKMLDSPPQTNEAARSAVLIAAGGFLAQRYGLPFVLSELGASAGLNLNWDRYALEVAGTRYGAPDANLVLTPDWRGDPPPAAWSTVVERRGVDLNPIDTTDPAARLRLRAYIWADQSARLDRQTRALAQPPVPVDRGDAADWLHDRLVRPHLGCLHLVYHTIAWQYFSDTTSAGCTAALAAAGARATDDAPLAHLSMETDGQNHGARVSLRLWPGDHRFDLGRADPHARWIDWHPIASRMTPPH